MVAKQIKMKIYLIIFAQLDGVYFWQLFESHKERSTCKIMLKYKYMTSIGLTTP